MNRLCLILALATAVASCSRGDADKHANGQPVPVRVVPVAVERIALPVTATGTLGPKEDVTLSFKIGGVVARVLVDEGETVRAGQLLANLDFGEIDPSLERARVALDKAERDLARAQRLYADSVATLEQVQNAESARGAAQAEFDAVSFNRRHAAITAPAAGVILRRHAEPGELVGPGAAIVSLGSNARGRVVRAWLADRDVVRVRGGDRATVRFDAIPDREFEGRVTEIAAAADPMTGTYRVEVSLSAGGLAKVTLASGLVGDVTIHPSTKREVALVPAVSVLEADGTRGVVFTIGPDGRTAHRRQVAIAFLAGDRVAISDGLDGATVVVTDGAAYLDEGDVVEIQL